MPKVKTANAKTAEATTPKKGLKRDTIDKFYTTPAVALQCQALIQGHLSIGPNDLIIEPSAGNGVFLPIIKALTTNYRFYDIAPEHSEIHQQDYLNLATEAFLPKNKIHVIGNPPFGRQSSLAIKFIKKSCEFCHSLSFILPKSFKKDSLKKTFPPYFHLRSETDLPEKAFLVDGIEYSVPCVFQIWEKCATTRAISEKIEPTKFTFVKQHEHPDISFRRVGVNAGVIDTVALEEKSAQSHYFIKFASDVKIKPSLLAKLRALKFAADNTVGPRSISKQELSKEFNMVL
jgi:hypothetical protein